MKKRGVLYALLISICSVGIGISTFSITKAWFSSGSAFGNQTLQASSVSNYFARGDGSEENPFIIDQPVHMYNLSWLQARGVFDAQKTYFKVADVNGDPITIDFAGQLTGTTTTTGAIPPIGTDAHHFIGEFDGNGSVLKNLWVSSNPDDWKEKPVNIGDANTNTHVGFFGNIDQNNEDKGVVKNFTLENIEVTSHVDSSFVGLVAGYSNSYTENIGVKNGKLSFRQGNQNHYMSEASLIGKVGDEVYWEDMPSDGSEGGELKIDPNDSQWSGGHFSGVSSGAVQVPGSVEGTAYISSSMGSSSQALTTVYKYTTKLNFENDNGRTLTPSTSELANASNNRTLCSGEFWNTYDNHKDLSYSITPNNGAPSNNQTNSITVNGVNKTIPKNCIWFKPKASGTCGVSFMVPNMSGSRYMSLYRYLRNGNSIPNTSNWSEIILVFNKTGGLKNKNIVYYEIDITDEEIEAGYEYCIGVSRNNSGNPGNFFFLYLAGTNTSGGPSEGMALLKNIDYVYKYNGQYLPSFTDEDYRPNHLKIIFDFNTDEEDVVFLYNMDDIQNSQYVYYYASGATLVDMVSQNSVGVLETTTTRFPPRVET